MKKLCYVLPQYHHKSAENFYHIINFLSELGKRVELYVIIENSDNNPIIDNVKEIFVINNTNIKYNYFIRFSKIIKIYFNLYKKGVKMFFARASSTGVFPLVVANKYLNFNKADIIFWSCGQDVIPLTFDFKKKNIKRILTRVLSKFIFSNINYLATGPETMIDYYHETYKIPKRKIQLLYNDISLKRFYPLNPIEKRKVKNELLDTKKKVMLFVHTFNLARGTDLLHKIALNIKKHKHNIVIVAIGREGDYSKYLEAEIIKYDLSEQLMNLGTIPNKDIVQYYQVADLFLMPSRGEGFPRVIIEAMACKCVPFSFDVGGVRDILHKDISENTMTKVHQEDKFMHKSIQLINDNSLLDEYAELSYEKVQEFKTEVIVEMYLNKFKELEKK